MKKILYPILLLSLVFGLNSCSKNTVISIEKTNTEGLVDTYTITYNNGLTYTFTVTNGDKGEQGTQGIQGNPGENGHTPIISIGENGNWFIDGVDSKQKASLKGDKGDSGKDGNTPYIGSNGNWFIGSIDTGIAATGEQGIQGEQGLSAYEIYLKYHPEYTGTEEEWVNGLFKSGTAIETGSFSYIKNADLVSYTLTSYTGDDKGITIPVSYNGFPVTAIDDNAFLNNTTIENVLISDYIISIGNSAFSGCTNLKTITFGKNIVSIGDEAFLNNAISSAYLYDNVTSIGNNCFKNCQNLVDFHFSSALTSLGDGVFHSCYKLSNVILPDGINKIGDNTFYNCHKIETIKIPKNVQSIGDSAFYNCNTLTSIDFSDNNCLTTIGQRAFMASSLVDINLPNSVTSIATKAFSSNTLESVFIPSTCTNIEDGVFDYCPSLRKISLPYVMNKTFGCLFETNSYNGSYKVEQNGSTYYLPLSLSEVNINGGKLVDYAFNNCMYIDFINIDEVVTFIPKYCFANCKSLLTFTINENVSAIGERAFSECNRLVEVINYSNLNITNEGVYGLLGLKAEIVHNDESKVKIVNDFAFLVRSNKVQLLNYLGISKYITLPESYKGIQYEMIDYCFAYNIELKEVTMSSCVESISKSAFYQSTSLEKVNFVEGLKYINSYAFNGCTALTSIELPNSMIKVCSYSFCFCEKLTTLKTGDGLTTIEQSAFSSCYSLANVYIGKNVSYIYGNAFNGSYCNNVYFDTSISSVFKLASSLEDMNNDVYLKTFDVDHFSSDNVGIYISDLNSNYYWYK